MAVLNKPGVLMYHVALFLLVGTLFATLKNFNLEELTETAHYSDAVMILIFGLVGATIAFGFVVTIASLISKERKSSGLVKVMLIFMWINLAVMALYTYFLDILDEGLTNTGVRYLIIILCAVLFFITAMGVVLFKFPGKIEESVLAEKVKRKLMASEKKEKKPYCPECRADVESSFKFCPKCGAKFSD